MKVQQLRIFPDHVEAEVLVDPSTGELHEFTLVLEEHRVLQHAVEVLEAEVLQETTRQVEGWLR